MNYIQKVPGSFQSLEFKNCQNSEALVRIDKVMLNKATKLRDTNKMLNCQSCIKCNLDGPEAVRLDQMISD